MPDNNNILAGKKLKIIRLSLLLSRKTVSEIAGTPTTTLTRMEEGIQSYPTVYVSSHLVHENAEKIVQKKLLIESVRTRLYILFLQKILDRKRMGSDNTYHYKKL